MPYYSRQEKAAYILSVVKNQIDNFDSESKRQISSMYNAISNFEIITNFSFDDTPNQSYGFRLAKVAKNIVRRGCPTLSPCFVEDIFANCRNEITEDRVKRSLIIYDSDYRFSLKQRYYQKNNDGSVTPAEVNNTECRFLCNLDTVTAQHLELQRAFETIIECPNTDIEKYSNYARFCLDKGKDELLKHFRDQRTDFSLIIPAIDPHSANCLNIEIDGPQHTEPTQKYKDEDRDCLLKELLWAPPIRIKNIDNSSQYERTLKDFMAPVMAVLGNNDEILDEVILPIYVARVTMTVLELIEQRVINPFGKKDIKIHAIANSSPYGVLMGVVNAVYLIRHLGKMVKPDIDLANVYLEIDDKQNESFGNYYLQHGKKTCRIEEKIEGFDITIVEAMNRRIAMFSPLNEKRKTVYIYSAYAEDEQHHIEILNKPIKYNISEANYDDVEYFLQNIFHKEHFRPKQFDIVKAALNGKNVVGVLPTGSGKTITFQLPALLQPAITLVISPLVSLMVDQVSNLNKIGIGNCATINGMIKGIQKRFLMNEISDNKFQIIYISPERLQIKAFKELMHGLTVAEVVLDEAHCVSQWGHDFRTSYLRVGQSIEKVFGDIVIMALTGTASCNVITDIKRELNMKKNVDVITPTSFRRNELHFRIMEMEEDLYLRDRIGKRKIEEVWDESVRIISARWGEQFGANYYEKQADEYRNVGIVFCPFAKKKNESVDVIAERLSDFYGKRGIAVGKYHGQCSDKEKETAQENFIEGRTAVLVATKAFGMGIDKPNIRLTVHTAVPESIEAFYQEAGRAGRDGKPALNIIISPPLRMEYEDIKDYGIYEFFFNQSFPDKEEFKKSIEDFMNTSFLIQKNFSSSIMESIAGDELGGEIAIRLNEFDGGVDVSIGAPAGKEKYRMSLGNEGKPDIVSKNPEHSIHKNFLFRLFEKFILSSISKSIESRNIKEPNKFEAAFSVEKIEHHDSLIELLGKPDFDGQYCYVGLDSSMMDNSVDRLLEDLIKERSGKPILTSRALMQKISLQKSFFDNVANRNIYQLKKFMPLYNELRVHNRMNTLNEEEFEAKCNFLFERHQNHIDNLQEKIIYYLGILGVYDEYERSYSPNYIKIRLRKVDKDSLKANIRRYIGGYETRDYLNRRLGKMESFKTYSNDNVLGIIMEALNYVIDYAYDKIKTFRHMQAKTMYRCMQANDPKHEEAFVDEIYKYFESKYADELLSDVKNENLSLVEKWIDRIEKEASEGSGNIKENLSHLRASALKIQEARPQAFTPYFLYAYCSMADPDLDIRNGIDAYLNGIRSIKKSRANYHAMVKRLCDRLFSSSEQYYLEETERQLDLFYTKKKDKNDLEEMISSLKATESGRKG